MTISNCVPLSFVATGRLLAVSAGLLLAYMTLAWLIAKGRRRLDTVDIAWGLGFLLVAWSVVLQESNRRTLLVAALVSIWGLRLAYHIGRRSLRSPQDDPRYTELSQKWQGNKWLRAYVSIFLLQGALVLLVGLPISLVARRPLNGWSWLVWVGAAVWLIGFVFEAIADRQLARFIRQADHPKVLSSGLWRYSRHPNYFGELVQWWGIGIIALQASWGWLGLLGPLMLTGLILFVSGIPPIEKRRAKDAEYRRYQRQTSPLLPLPARLKK